MPKSALIITAHSDDNIASACTLMKLRDQGYRLFELILTDSSEGRDRREEQEGNQITQLRAKELSKAAEFIGIEKVFSLGQPDLGLVFSKELMLEIVEVIRETKPEVVFIHNEYDGHIDHRAAHQLSAEACRWAASGVRPDLGERHRPNLILQFEGMIPAKPVLLVDVSDYFERKKELWNIYLSQGTEELIEFTQSYMRIRGNLLRTPGRAMAEGFTPLEMVPSIIFQE